mgnify:CR=1 FL=1
MCLAGGEFVIDPVGRHDDEANTDIEFLGEGGGEIDRESAQLARFVGTRCQRAAGRHDHQILLARRRERQRP